MGLDIGIISMQYLERPRGIAYRFAWELAVEASTSGYMHGDDNSYGPFSKGQMRRMLQHFARDKGLSQEETAEVRAWIDSLPWDGNHIELHFNW